MQIRNSDPGNAQRIVLGHVTVPEGETRHVANYQTASWWTDEALTPGTYEVTTNGYWVFVKIPSTITNASFPSSFGGVQYGGSNSERHVGRESVWWSQDYLYAFGAIVEAGLPTYAGLPFTLAEGITIVPVERYSDLFERNVTDHEVHLTDSETV